jgi:flagellar capping protein FliD
MKLVTSLAFALAATLSASAFAADKAPADKLTPQQQKLSDCAKDAHAKNLKGDEFKSYMSTCTKGSGTAAKTASSTTKSPPTNQTAAGDVATSTTSADKAQAASKKAAPESTTGSQWVAGPGASNSQQQKMKTCATDAKAKGLKGNDRRTYMSTCLKGDKATPAATDTTTPPAKKSGT